MELKGKIIQKLPPQGGISKNGNAWKKQEYVLETLDAYPSKVKFDIFGDKVDQYPMEVGDTVTIQFDIESREFNGRWYTDIHAYQASLHERANAGIDPAFYPGNTGDLIR